MKLANIRGGDAWVKSLPDGSSLLLTVKGIKQRPQWSPSGHWLAFRKDENSAWLADADANVSWVLNQESAIDAFTWSPLTDTLANTSGGVLYTFDADSKEAKHIFSLINADNEQPENQISGIAWSPDGNRVACEWRSTPDGQTPVEHGIRVLSVGAETEVEEYKGDPTLVGWTADGCFLLFWKGVFSASLAADGVPLFSWETGISSPIRIENVMLA